MARDPLASVVDAPLFIVPRVLDGLRAYRADAPPGLDRLADTLLAGIAAHPTKFWVLKQFQKTLDPVDDMQARERIATEMEKMMDILGIASSDGVLGSSRR